jgi:hypothetical protein
MDEGGLSDSLRKLHAPETDYGLVCAGCDSTDEMPSWPCRTADLLYSETEIAEVKAAYADFSKWSSQTSYRARMATGWGMGDEIAAIYRPMVLAALRPLPFFGR